MNIPDSLGLSKQDYFEAMGHDWQEVEQILRLDRIYKARVNSQEDIHHLIAQSKHGSNHGINRKVMVRGDHVAFHDVFGVKMFHEQVLQLLSFHSPIITKDTTSRLKEVFIGKSRSFYKQEAFGG